MGNVDTQAPHANLKCHFWVLSEKGNTVWLLNKSFFFTKQKSYSCLLIKSVPQNVGVNPSVQQLIAPAEFWPRGQNPRRHPRSPRVYTYKNKE